MRQRGNALIFHQGLDPEDVEAAFKEDVEAAFKEEGDEEEQKAKAEAVEV